MFRPKAYKRGRAPNRQTPHSERLSPQSTDHARLHVTPGGKTGSGARPKMMTKSTQVIEPQWVQTTRTASIRRFHGTGGCGGCGRIVRKSAPSDLLHLPADDTSSEAALSRRREDAWALGILFSQSGLMQIPETQLLQGALLAIEEINAAGGALGRPIEAIHYDPRSDPGLYRQYADRLLTEDAVSVIIGCCTSLSRKVVLPSLERRNGLLWYPDLYEGFEYSPNVIYTLESALSRSVCGCRHRSRRHSDCEPQHFRGRSRCRRKSRMCRAHHRCSLLQQYHKPCQSAFRRRLPSQIRR